MVIVELVPPRSNNSWDDDDGEKDNNADTNPDAHFHVLPPHLPPDLAGAVVEMSGLGLQAVRLVSQRGQTVATIVDLHYILACHLDNVIDIPLNVVHAMVRAARRIGRALRALPLGLERVVSS
jgi:hypothetical protein